MAQASPRTKFWVWGIVLIIFAGAAWFAISTLRASFQPLAVIQNPFPDEEHRPEGSDAPRGAVNFLVFGEAASSNHTLSIFHLAEGRRRIDIVNFPPDSTDVTDINDIPATVVEVEALTDARMEHVLLWDLEFLTELETAPSSAEELLTSPAALNADNVWTTVLQETLDIRDPGQLNTLAATLTPYVAADAGLNTGRITDLARSLRHVAPEAIASCVLPAELSSHQQAALRTYFRDGSPVRCAELFQ